MKQIFLIGLGNPDPEYAGTRHNIGFLFLDYVAKKTDASPFEEKAPFQAQVASGKLEKTKIILIKPLVYVNNSGQAVKALQKQFKAKPEQFFVAHDDLDIPFGNVKNSFGKNAGGHHGVESIIKALKTKDFYRLRFGTSVRSLSKAREQSDKKRDLFVSTFVLKKFTPSEQTELKSLFKTAFERLQQLL